jgi:DNA/RNA-binding domain of Phe-tRNA-synthetase-like protein
MAVIELTVDPHPTLRHAAFTATFAAPVGTQPSPDWLVAYLRAGAQAPFAPDEALRTAVRDMLRHGGYKPTGRGKPASEYLVRAVAEGALGSINAAVDACNAVSLHSGFPVSLVDTDRAVPPFRISIATAGARYVFNRTGQEIDLAGLLCLFDAEGPCANAVKDAERTKTHKHTVHTLSIIWGVAGWEDRLRQAENWYRELLDRLQALTTPLCRHSSHSDVTHP